MYYNSQLGTYYTYNTEAGQYEPYYALETDNSITATAAAAMTTEDTTPHIEERETMSLKSRVVNESKMYLEIIQELGEECYIIILPSINVLLLLKNHCTVVIMKIYNLVY